jgi:hypothetical protein
MNNCPVCNKKILEEEAKYMVGLEVPYINIFFHLDCYKSISNMTEFLNKNISSILESRWQNKKKNK